MPENIINATPQEARSLRLKLDISLLEAAIKDLPRAFNYTPEVRDWQATYNAVKEYLPEQALSLFDQKYYFLSWDKWLEVISRDWINRQIYKVDHFDCDNFAFLFSAWAALVLGVNTATTIRGEYFQPNGTRIDGHLWNGIFALDPDGVIKLYWFEPQIAMFAEAVKGEKKFKLNQRFYQPTWLMAF